MKNAKERRTTLTKAAIRAPVPSRKRGAALARKRNLFGEIMEGLQALARAQEGKRTLRTHVVPFNPPPEFTPLELMQVRKTLQLSRAVFANCLRTNLRTLENWEQGRARPNAQAALLIGLVRKFPDTVQRLAAI
jgi:putative transcriptional regulator